jgi:outer membrane receptor protein involved in Fe transport
MRRHDLRGFHSKLLRAFCLVVGSSGILSAAHAQELEEIIVTAQKYEQRLQDVPVSISAITAEELSERNVTSLSELQYAIPGLSSFEYGPGQQFIQIRGVSTNVGNQTVGTYLDEMPVNGDAQGDSIDVRMLDMQRVEVLRGPQGTLYGEGSMGGTIRYITASPDLNALSGSIETEGAHVSDGAASYLASGVLNAPLSAGTAGLRLVAGYERDGGWIDDTTTGRSDINGVTLKTVRAKLLVTPTDRLNVSLLALHQESNQDNQNFGSDGKTDSTVQTFNNDRYTLVNGVLTYDFDALSLLESVGYLDRNSSVQDDLTPFYLPVLEGLGIPPGFISQISYPHDTTEKAYTDELRLASKGNTTLHWTVGLFYRHYEYDVTSGATTAPGSLPFVILATDQTHLSSSWAGFGEASYRLTDRFTALLGARYYQDRVEQDSDSTSFGFPAHDHGQTTFTTFNPRLNLQYTFSETSMVYASATKGFRSGGFNVTSAGGGVVAIPPTYAPDKLWTYELGTKQQLEDRKLEMDLSLYRTVWSDVQSTVFAPGSAIEVIENSGRVSGWGADLALFARPVDGLTLTATYGWNNLAFKDATADKVVGDPVDDAVRQTYSASADYRVPLSAGTKGFVRIDYQHAGKAQITLRDFGQIVHIEPRQLLTLRIGAEFGRFEASIFGSNLTNDQTPLIPGPFGVIANNVEQRPRTLGMNLRASF